MCSHRDSERPASLNNVRNGIYCLLLIHLHLNNQIAGTKQLLTKWKIISVQNSAIPLPHPFAQAYACSNIQSGWRFASVAILCTEAAYLWPIELSQLTWSDFILPGDLRLAHELLGSAAFVVQSPKNDKSKPQISTFNYTFVIPMLRIMEEGHTRQLATLQNDDGAPIQQQHICAHLTYHVYNDAIKTAATHFGLPNARFTTHGARIGASTAQFAEKKYIGPIKLVGGWKSQHSAKKYIRNGRAGIESLHIPPEAQTQILSAAAKFTKRMNRYISIQELTLVANAPSKNMR